MSHTTMDADELAQLVDHTLLKPESTPAHVAALAEEATELGTYSICVSPSMLPLAMPAGSTVKIATVCGFPSGAHPSQVKAAEAAHSVRAGAHEVDMVINLGAVKAGHWEYVVGDIAAVRGAAPRPVVLKVIIESAALTDDEIVQACRAAETAGADFVKTSTGFHPAGGATVHAVALMARTVGDRLGVKASGGVRTAADALAMIGAGATRLGLSGTAAVLAGLADLDETGNPVGGSHGDPAKTSGPGSVDVTDGAY
ncbi:deoxyribose-phosphate aldolase [Sanguibacter sp. 25GB23B1]|uniref:deoxyribose-phosphate aldolase n=1 Tax=unclassified Sanguibacter TaxID=2645534 RepID=UPI0032AF30E9